MSILDLLQQDGISPKRVASTRGGEYASMCPLCGGEDRFRSWPEDGEGGRWWCRQCGKGGDLVQYLRDVRGHSFAQACEYLGRPHRIVFPVATPVEPRRTPRGWYPRVTDNPSKQWQQKAESMVEWGRGKLLGNDGRAVFDWLRSQRGLSEETIQTFRLGWIPTDMYRDRTDWGLPSAINANGRPKKLAIPRGLVIPYVTDGAVIKAKFRVGGSARWPKYYLLPGSSKCPMITGGTGQILVVVESELDGILLHQECRDLASIMALGSANIRPDQTACSLLQRADLILVALDSDDAGMKESWLWWLQHFPQAHRWPPIFGKDPGEMYKAGIDIREWVEAGIEGGHTTSRSKIMCSSN